jgi:hypothetical protein
MVVFAHNRIDARNAGSEGFARERRQPIDAIPNSSAS